MFDAASRCEPAAAHQRARGALDVAFKRRGDATVLDRLRQDGALKARFPRSPDPAWAEAVMLNSSGGVASGDVLAVTAEAGAGARAVVATQAAERIYRAPPGGGPATIRNRVTVAAGAILEWLPQETILFNQASLDRRLDVEVAQGGRFLGCEALVFGRAAMGETVTTLALRDLIRVARNGVPVLHDAVRIEGAPAADRAACLRGVRAVATIVLVADDAESRLDALRAAFASAGAECGASAWDGMLVGRIAAADGARLRMASVAGIQALRDVRPLPRVWLC
jgi:urease accessory protein